MDMSDFNAVAMRRITDAVRANGITEAMEQTVKLIEVAACEGSDHVTVGVDRRYLGDVCETLCERGFTINRIREDFLDVSW